MAITIEDPEVERLARRLAAEQGVSVDRVIGEALRAQAGDASDAKRTTPPRSDAEVAEEVARIQREVAALPVLDPRPSDEILYDEHGLPK